MFLHIQTSQVTLQHQPERKVSSYRVRIHRLKEQIKETRAKREKKDKSCKNKVPGHAGFPLFRCVPLSWDQSWSRTKVIGVANEEMKARGAFLDEREEQLLQMMESRRETQRRGETFQRSHFFHLESVAGRRREGKRREEEERRHLASDTAEPAVSLCLERRR